LLNIDHNIIHPSTLVSSRFSISLMFHAPKTYINLSYTLYVLHSPPSSFFTT
jgi:hypothetical protein